MSADLPFFFTFLFRLFGFFHLSVSERDRNRGSVVGLVFFFLLLSSNGCLHFFPVMYGVFFVSGILIGGRELKKGEERSLRRVDFLGGKWERNLGVISVV